MQSKREPELGTIVQTEAGSHGEVIAVWENWQAPGNIHVRLHTGDEARWTHCTEVAR